MVPLSQKQISNITLHWFQSIDAVLQTEGGLAPVKRCCTRRFALGMNNDPHIENVH